MPEGQKDLAAVIARAKEYLAHGGFWNPEAMDHRKVSTLIQDLLALLLVEAQRQDQETKEDTTRVDGQTVMPPERATAALNETKEATVPPTLESLAQHLGWGTLSASAAFEFVCVRERMLRLVQSELETQKSDAPTAELALLDRVTGLKARALAALPETSAQQEEK